ncbi:hypothetical protein INT43_004070 [Umbelopsis isabellina]|uniref:Arylamine N-acetyltransferase n=1 Tax=Mortierella isabellina TaxID=91625 RepID=A0A8H7PUE0_MORIS|nr:hypothetical protein INT43_004070 [Umbelopsis isabellina]
MTHNSRATTMTERLTQEQQIMYLQRLDIHSNLKPNLESLRLLCIQHLKHIPFENLAYHYGPESPGIPVIDQYTVFNKIIKRRRGGNCFEMLNLFTALLISLGFDVTSGAARVYLGEGFNPPYTNLSHRILFVRLDSQLWLADVGFGAAALGYPALLSDSAVPTPNGIGDEYVLVEKADDMTWILKHTYDLKQRPFRPSYKFTMDAYHDSHYNKFNISVSCGENLLTQNVVAVKLQQAGDRLERLTLMNDKLHVSGIGKYELIQTFVSDHERVAALRKWLYIELTHEESVGLANSKMRIYPQQ